MAQRAVAINGVPRGLVPWAGAIVSALLVLLCLGTVLAVFLRAESAAQFSRSDWVAVRFTVTQAFLSALLSVVLAIPVARALARREFRGRHTMIALLGAPFILPVIVAILGLLAVFGRTGVLSTFLGWFGLPPVQIYGLHGVVLAHVFFNLPLAVRFLLQGWAAIPAEHFRLVASLGGGPRDVGRLLERPMLWRVLPGTFALIFLICTTSFAVALALGGGPKATTVELAIYQAFRFDFDLSKAALLAIVQLVLSGAAAIAAWKFSRQHDAGQGLDRVVQRYDRAHGRLADAAWLGFVVLLLGLPLVMVVMQGAAGFLSMPASVWAAAGRSLLVALASTCLAVTFGLALSLWLARLRGAPRAVGEMVAYLTVAVSPLVMGAGLFILIFPFASPRDWALPITALVNAAMALPFVTRALMPAVEACEAEYGPLAESLRLRSWARLRYLTLPRLRRPIGFVAGLAAALSMGDLGVVALFADPEQATLPLKLYDLMGAYRMDAAAGAGLLLMGLSFGLFYLFDRGGRMNASV
ncbi:thiamine/thiamine pyrophosphate ABC transporter permease ThiP [Halocynthiibacter sp. C4]|uniref:thiamine/thiamine pyrophosphate ABC transporter permease ThiP n=1 Tax=Halocynthiibacter sp. C4 TaxID=2992758 RepID=UPI00237C2460|nr:thiamine/thiamine pyrophosphate ABC transporter permease ThiP [Halocynthiibacter sp. C4]MDE0590877.1 thiamine/thiamine pyrophosphate ABC transporter permease ThiP [Halocynthiibacter sp. C4]